MKKVLYIFGQLSDTDVDWLIANGSKQSLTSGTPLIREGVDIDALYVLLRGHVSVSTAAAGQVARLGWGEIVGEMSLVDTQPPSATVTATEESMALRIPRAKLGPKLQNDSKFAANLYRAISITLTERLRAMNRAGGAADEELSPELLDTVHLAGARFDRLLKAVMG